MGGTTQASKYSRIWPHPPFPTLQGPPLTQCLDETKSAHIPPPHSPSSSSPRKWNCFQTISSFPLSKL